MSLSIKVYSTLILLIIYIIESHGDDCFANGRPRLISTDDDHYLFLTVRTYTGQAPKLIKYSYGDIFYKIGNKTFVSQSQVKKDIMIKYEVMMKPKNIYVDDWGNSIHAANNTMFMIQQKPLRKLKILTHFGNNNDQMSVDMDKNRIFFIGYDAHSDNTDFGRLFTINMANVDIVGAKIFATNIDHVGNQISAISVDVTTGNIAMAIQIKPTKWTLNIMERVSIFNCKNPKTYGIYKNSLETAVKLAGEQLITLYEEAILGNEESEILKRQQLTVFPNGGSRKSLLMNNQESTIKNNIDNKDADICGQRFDDMSEEIDKLKTNINTNMKDYNLLYTKIFSSNVINGLVEFENRLNFTKLEPINTNETTVNAVYFNQNDIKYLENLLGEAKSLMNTTIKYFTFVKDLVDNTYPLDEISLDIRISDQNNNVEKEEIPI